MTSASAALWERAVPFAMEDHRMAAEGAACREGAVSADYGARGAVSAEDAALSLRNARSSRCACVIQLLERIFLFTEMQRLLPAHASH